MSISWYLNRLRTMSVAESLFRVQQIAFRIYAKLFLMGWDPGAKRISLPRSLLRVSDKWLAAADLDGTSFDILGLVWDYSKPHNWHLDIRTGSIFPKIFSRDVNTRSDEVGIAKYVWEPNRMQFLPRLCYQYRATSNREHLDLFMRHMRHWKAENPYLVGVNWYSNIEVNIRLINWFLCWEILNLTRIAKEDSEVSIFLEECLLPLIYMHCRFAHSFPSRFSSANNHLIAEGVGLFIAASYWKFDESDEWLASARNIVEREILLQHTPDGINREETSEYIQFITDYFLIAHIVAERTGRPLAPAYGDRLHRIFGYIDSLMARNGHIIHYGDADNGRTFILEDRHEHFNNFQSLITSGAIIFSDSALKRSGATYDLKNRLLFGDDGEQIFNDLSTAPVERGSSHYPEAGHYLFRKETESTETMLHFVATPLGYLSIAGHGHADALSLNLLVDGDPVLVDCGTYSYHTEIPWRNYFKGTLAHCTVRLGERDQATIGGPVMWRDHYQCHSRFESGLRDEERVTASHTGYAVIGCSHQRTVCFEPDNEIFIITDRLTSGTPTTFELMFHIHPDLAISVQGHAVELKTMSGAVVRLVLPDSGAISLHKGETKPILGWLSPDFYKKVPCLAIAVKGQLNGQLELISTIDIKRG